ncbi:MAG: hypothetical protein H7326_11280 [Bdellovibrionaceae bacterium]|nr:hypothetical protein [Pseudobdellovibrionaceae bacterium]
MNQKPAPVRGTTKKILMPGMILLATGIGGIMLTRFILPSLIAGTIGLGLLIFHRVHSSKPPKEDET